MAAILPDRIEKAVQDYITNAGHRITVPHLEREIARREACPRTHVRSALRGLIDKEVLEYRYSLGQSYIALSFRRPVDVSPRFTIVPPGCHQFQSQERIPIVIAPGSAFGDGRHPTTRLALKGLEIAWHFLYSQGIELNPAVIDIGTGTGVLAIAAASLGAGHVTALDNDACARAEACQNVRLNPAAERVAVANHPISSINVAFDLIMANLRLPTLVQMGNWMQSHLKYTGCLLVSGCREEEWCQLVNTYAGMGLQCQWYETLTGWAGGLFSFPTLLSSDATSEMPLV